MKSHQTQLIAIFDAMSNSPTSAYGNFASVGALLGDAFIHEHVGVITRTGSSLALGVVLKVASQGGAAILISPASSLKEHTQAFRLPVTNAPIIYSGRGGIGADSIVSASAHSVLIIGSEDEALESILGFLSDKNIPIAILTNEPSVKIHERVHARYPALSRSLIVSNDPVRIMRELGGEMRRQSFISNK